MQISESDRSILISEVSLNEDICKDILEPEKDVESEANIYYSNKAYADLMSLVTKYKLSNVTRNAIIKFFNKYVNLNSSSLSKLIEEERNFMDNMNLPNLTFDKTHVITYNNNNYYLHHRSLIKCIKNILS